MCAIGAVALVPPSEEEPPLAIASCIDGADCPRDRIDHALAEIWEGRHPELEPEDRVRIVKRAATLWPDLWDGRVVKKPARLLAALERDLRSWCWRRDVRELLLAALAERRGWTV